MYSDIPGRKYGTERCERLLGLLNSPDKKLKIIHIAGTNGKGSTAAYISCILTAWGKKTGTFTSPWVYDYGEQFKINTLPVPAETFLKYMEEVEAIAETMEDKPSAFERETAAAIYAFCSEGCEYAVLECGLGGKDDATNAVSAKEMAVITSISLEHTRELGATVEEICMAKSGIIKNCPLVLSAGQSEEVVNFFKKFNPKVAGEGMEITSAFPFGNTFKYNGESYKIKLNGERQCYNAAAAIEAAKLLNVPVEFIKKGLAAAETVGRIQLILSGGRTFILDGSHNPESFYPLADGLKRISSPKELVFGCLSDKDVESAAKILSPYFKRVIVFSPSNPRAMECGRIYSAFSACAECVVRAETVEEALSKTSAETVVVCGSFSILKEAKAWIEKK